MSHAHRFSKASDALTFVLAGNATFTLVSERTGARFTYKVRLADRRPNDPRRSWFVSLLSGPNNEADYVYVGMIREGFGNDGPAFRTTAKTKASPDAPSIKAIGFAVHALYDRGEIPAGLQVWHEGRCCRCGRVLTVPSSIENGIGPDCAEKMAA